MSDSSRGRGCLRTSSWILGDRVTGSGAEGGGVVRGEGRRQYKASTWTAGTMGCIHSVVIRKEANQGPLMDHNDPHTEPAVSPGILQLAGVSSSSSSRRGPIFVSQLLAVEESALVCWLVN